ncbi:helix-turn-helix domain-containing protein [Caballeronia sp. NCTM5]|uniref:helix-turn-helix domain-containing protein n=1 Tax=Caballeronia sp. NCTM5 TaxID=2921755 RepID=UPI0020296150|nr:helix-turn-helix domain-containing protein [Caballeronia sp. NCTM5]
MDSDEITREEAAAILHVSLVYLDKLIVAGVLPGVNVTDGRERILKSSLLAYKRKLRRQQKTGLKDMVEASERAGLYEVELKGVAPHRRKSEE